MGSEAVDLRFSPSGFLTSEQALAINSDNAVLRKFIAGIPKAELHLHIEGTFEPELMLEIAKRNGIECGATKVTEKEWCTAEKRKRDFNNLQEFLDVYYAACDVLQTEQDFRDLAWSYLTKASENNIRHVEMSFDPQTHMKERNSLDISTIVNGLSRACAEAKELLSPPVHADLILCFLRHRHPGCEWAQPPAEENEALSVLEEVIAKGLTNKIVAVGLDSSEKDNPPELFKEAFDRARQVGLKCVAHAGEEGPAEYITKALDVLKVSRIDHGVRCLEDKDIVRRLANERVPLTVCPCSNHRLKVADRYFSGENPVRRLLHEGIVVTLNSDDPAYFFGHKDKFGEVHGGYLNANYVVAAKECALSADEVVNLAVNSFESSFLTEQQLGLYKKEIEQYCKSFKP